MSSFVTFNELSLPLGDFTWKEELRNYIEVINSLRCHGVNTIRTDKLFSERPNFTETKSLAEFFGSISPDMKTRLKSLLFNQTNIFQSPLINEEEEPHYTDFSINSEFYFEGNVNTGGLACAYIWNTLSISFPTHGKWAQNEIELQKSHVSDNDELVSVKHISQVESCTQHQLFLQSLASTPQTSEEILAFIQTTNDDLKFVVNFNDEAKKHLYTLESQGSDLIVRLFKVLRCMKRTPGEGIGKPELLVGDLAGFASRRITEEHRIVYRQLPDNIIEVIRCIGHYE